MFGQFFNAFVQPFRAVYNAVNVGVFMVCNLFYSGEQVYQMHERAMTGIGNFVMNAIFA